MKKEECTWWVNHLFEIRKEEYFNKGWMEDAKEVDEAQQMAIDALKQTAWIPVGERLPDELKAVTVTWVNHNPPVYYQHIKDVPQTETAVYYRGAWYWWEVTVIDLLGEYGDADIFGVEPINKDIEVTAWMPLPEPYREDGEE